MLILHVDTKEFWNGEGWVDKAQALADLADPNRPNILLETDMTNTLSQSTGWSYQLATNRTGQFITQHQTQNGAYVWSTSTFQSTRK
jgi:hypothetical protein